MSLHDDQPTWWEETAETAAWLSIVWSARREERRALRDAMYPRRAEARRVRLNERRSSKVVAGLTAAQKREIRARLRRGLSQYEIVRAMGISPQLVRAQVEQIRAAKVAR